jgi:hypothetical protein
MAASSIPSGRSARRRTLALAASIAVLALAAIAPLDAAAASTQFGVNLARNANAENGVGGWEVFPDPSFTTRPYGPSGFGFPSKATGQAIGGGRSFFTPGPWDTSYSECGDAKRLIVLTGIGSAIDNGHVKVYLKGYAGTNAAADLNAHLDLTFRDDRNHPVARNGITRQVTGTNEHYQLINGSAVLPKHTRQLWIHMFADGADAQSGGCAAFWDNLSVTLKSV